MKEEGPYHDWLMEIIRRLPTDGLIQREGRLKGSVIFIIAMMNAVAVNVVNDNHVNLFGPTLASSVSRRGITLSQCYPSRQLSAL